MKNFKPIPPDDPSEDLIGNRVSLIMSTPDARRCEQHIKSNTDLVSIHIQDLPSKESRVTITARVGKTNFKRRLLLLTLRSLTQRVVEYDASEGMSIES